MGISRQNLNFMLNNPDYLKNRKKQLEESKKRETSSAEDIRKDMPEAIKTDGAKIRDTEKILNDNFNKGQEIFTPESTDDVKKKIDDGMKRSKDTFASAQNDENNFIVSQKIRVKSIPRYRSSNEVLADRGQAIEESSINVRYRREFIE